MSLTPWRLGPVVLLSLAPFAWFYAGNLHEPIRPGDLALYALATAALACGLTVVLELLLRAHSLRTASTVAVGTLLFFSYHNIASLQAQQGLSNGDVLGLYGLGSLVVLVVAAAWGARPGFHNFLTFFAAANLGVALVLGASRSFDAPHPTPGAQEPSAARDIGSGVAHHKRNVYWIVVDSYPNRPQLLDYYGFDNTRFLDTLKNLGFIVSDRSYANFGTTLLSVPSTLDMNYVFDEEDPVYEIEKAGRWYRLPGGTRNGVNAAVAGDNRTVSMLRQQGYIYIHYSGGIFLITRCQGYEDICLEARPASLSDLQYRLLSLTPLRALLAQQPALRRILDPRRPAASGTGIVELGEQLATAPLPEPFFLYAHIASPHRPYTNNAQCDLLPLDFDRRGNRHFLAQLSCVNRHLEMLLDAIVQRDPDAIVLLSSDHGPRLSIRKGTSIYALSEAQIRESLGILHAFRLPEDCRQHVTADMTPVNSMRLVFACLAGEEPRFLAPKHYIARPDAPERGRLRRVQID